MDFFKSKERAFQITSITFQSFPVIRTQIYLLLFFFSNCQEFVRLDMKLIRVEGPSVIVFDG